METPRRRARRLSEIRFAPTLAPTERNCSRNRQRQRPRRAPPAPRPARAPPRPRAKPKIPPLGAPAPALPSPARPGRPLRRALTRRQGGAPSAPRTGTGGDPHSATAGSANHGWPRPGYPPAARASADPTRLRAREPTGPPQPRPPTGAVLRRPARGGDDTSASPPPEPRERPTRRGGTRSDPRQTRRPSAAGLR